MFLKLNFLYKSCPIGDILGPILYRSTKSAIKLSNYIKNWTLRVYLIFYIYIKTK